MPSYKLIYITLYIYIYILLFYIYPPVVENVYDQRFDHSQDYRTDRYVVFVLFCISIKNKFLFLIVCRMSIEIENPATEVSDDNDRINARVLFYKRVSPSWIASRGFLLRPPQVLEKLSRI